MPESLTVAVYEAMNDTQQAIKAYQDALMLEPNNPKHLAGLLHLSIEAKNKSVAIRTFDKVVALSGKISLSVFEFIKMI